MKKFILKSIVLSAMLMGLPLLGASLQGKPPGAYLEFPLRTHPVIHALFSWMQFSIYTLLILGATLPIVYRLFQVPRAAIATAAPRASFPWWGWLGTAMALFSWVLAWNRFPWFAPFQAYTFTPLWFSFILVVNAMGYRRTGKCLLTHRTRFFLLLFPVSGAFWWYFEYLNQFVQNWHYQVPRYDSLEYFLAGTLPFSTVLPAVLSVRECLLSWSRLQLAFADFLPLRFSHPRTTAILVLGGSAAVLTEIGVYPDFLFPFLWVSPLLILLSLQTLAGERHILAGIAHGDWRFGMASALAGLVCGIFWEMWNHYSLAGWHYAIPYVHRFEVFRMPLLGYAGYLPFGLECAAVGSLLESDPTGEKASTEA